MDGKTSRSSGPKAWIQSFMVGCFFLGPLTTEASPIIWNHNGRAQTKGSGCPAGSTEIITAGDEVSIIFSQMGVELSSQDQGKLARKVCRLIIPVKVNRHHYLASFHQNLSYGYSREKNTSGKIRVSSKYHREKAAQIVIPIPHPLEDPWQVPWAESQLDFHWPRRREHCQPRPYKTRFVVRMAIVAKRRRPNRQILIEADGFDLRLDTKGQVGHCPSRHSP